MKKMQNSYKKSGVNITLANKLVEHISNVSRKNVKKMKSKSLNDLKTAIGDKKGIIIYNYYNK